ncbi:MAG: GNAT family N-acetyltransferase [Aquabacterium sp.]|jgi:hypothetical protein|uniref:GNAT family N-acetyltransferase n=1 Tax=Aquabacterium sp. TaxID=1872578 RepID=UPI003BAF671F
MTIRVEPYTEARASDWERFCEGALNSTMLHTRRFLSYHGDRFKDCSLMLLDDRSIIGVFPAAERPADARLVVSHPGATYGGVVHDGRLGGERMMQALQSVVDFYRAQGYAALHYKALPSTYSRVPAQDDLYALFRLGAVRIRCDLSSSVCLSDRRPAPERRRRALKKSLAQVSVEWDTLGWPQVWQLIADNLARKHGASPVHTVEELAALHQRFPDLIRIASAHCEGTPVAAVVLFNARHVWHAQYIASSERGHETHALDAIFESVISRAAQAGARYFDFGTSNEEAGKILNSGLYQFKSEFGGGGVVHEFYELTIQ